ATAGAAGVTGPYQLGDIEIDISDGVPMREDGVLAGTVLTMIEAVRNLHALGISFEDAVGAATSVPARILGRDDLGVLEPGGLADIVVLDDRLEIVRVLCGGEARVGAFGRAAGAAGGACAADRQAGRARPRDRGDLRPRRRAVHRDRLARELVERGALRAIPPR